MLVVPIARLSSASLRILKPAFRYSLLLLPFCPSPSLTPLGSSTMGVGNSIESASRSQADNDFHLLTNPRNHGRAAVGCKAG